jgi:hypothetical protein
VVESLKVLATIADEGSSRQDHPKGIRDMTKTTNYPNRYTAGDLEIGDTLERTLWPFTVAKVTHGVGGWNGKLPVVHFTAATGERLSLLADYRLTVPVTKA